MSVVETHKLLTLEHLYLKGECVYIYVCVCAWYIYYKHNIYNHILKFSLNQKQTYLAEIKPRHNKYSPTNQKVHKEFNFPFFHSEIWLQSVICFTTQHGTEYWETQPLESLRSHLVGRPWATGKSTPDYLAGCQTVLSPFSRPPQNHLGPPALSEQSRVHKTQRTRMWLQQGAGTLCFYMSYYLGPRRRKGERAVWGRGSGWAPKLRWRVRLLSLHLGKQKWCPVFPNWRKNKKVRFTLWELTEAKCSVLDEALESINAQLSIKHITRKKIFSNVAFLMGARVFFFFNWTSWFLWGDRSLGTDTTQGSSVLAVWGSSQELISNNVSQTHCLCFAWKSPSVPSPWGIGP